MRLTTTALGIVLAAGAAPLFAQSTYTPPAATVPQNLPEQGERQPQQQQNQQQKQQQPAQQSTGIVTHTPRVSKGAVKALQALQTAVNSGDQAAIAAALPAAQAAASTADDRYVIALLQLKAAAAAKNQAAVAAAIEAMLASGSTTPNELFPLYVNLGQTYGALKQYDRAAAAYQKALQLSPNSVDATAGLAEVQIGQGNAAAAIATLQKGITLQQAGGGKASEDWYKRAVSLAYNAKLPAAVDLSRQWAQAYPSADSWRNAIAIYRNLMHPPPQAALDVLRLARVTNAMSGEVDYHLYAYQTAEQLNFGEAKAAIDEGIKTGKISASMPLIREIQSVLRTKPAWTDAQLADAIKTATTPNAVIRIADRYYGRGDYAKAAELYRKALAMPGADTSLANLHLGIALARAGDKAGATTALNAVTGANAEVAKFWLAYLNQRA